MVLLVVSMNRNTGFYSNLDVIYQSKESAIYFAESRLLLSTLVEYANSQFDYSQDSVLSGFDELILSTASS